MKAGIIVNTSKARIAHAVKIVVQALTEVGFEYAISDSVRELPAARSFRGYNFADDEVLISSSDIIISIGGDGTLLYTASKTFESGKPIVGINFGKLGFLTEIQTNGLKDSIRQIKEGDYMIEERIVLVGESEQTGECDILAINDIVIEKGGWPKMMEIALFADDEPVSEFTADGLIISTPTGSTGYSMSAGGPIVSPLADVVVISPICPHSLTMRPLVLPAEMTVSVEVTKHPVEFSINCDGQRVHHVVSPFRVDVKKGEQKLKLIRTHGSNYFSVLRSKLFWGLDVRGKS
ncbi:MAG: NAD(+)/NADH kinase [Ignavibacteriales bacterium]|nr:MAG: NAD(+)/NADH kinase [Ignavibacteriaceae bacterium]MBW7873022.1 NAD(+)/NADH kinase [Ignavibacteria bacterium]MCZ2142349.1 NAD(+)/NADH kinase [Ignavibacteriales bacterium]MBV6445233.1 NAD kinase [Ignavibacteriaceae bacterium]MBZ0195889.1 NAD(+)/NADH kinase [Ignavibacteriaceae bacterium]